MPADKGDWIARACWPGWELVEYIPGFEAVYEHRHGGAVIWVGHLLEPGLEGFTRPGIKKTGDCPLAKVEP